MNKVIKSVIVSCILVLSSFPLFSDEMTAVWSRIYDQTENNDARISVLQNIIDLHNPDMEEFISKAFTEEVDSIKTFSTFNDQYQSNLLKSMMIRELGRLRAKDSGYDMYRVMKETDNEFLRSDAIVGIGTVGAVDYADEVADHLRYLNEGIIEIVNNEQRGSVVNACVLALERFKLPVGFKPVFIAAIGRYSRDTVVRSRRSLFNMLEDPTDLIIDILKSDTSFAVRFAALDVENSSKASNLRKTEVARKAIEVALFHNATTSADKPYQDRSKVRGAEMIRDLGVADEQSIDLLGKMLNTSDNINEIIIAIQALGIYKSDKAVEVLNTYLSYHSGKRAAGKTYTPDDERAIRECINSLAKSGNQKAKESLTMVEYSNWSNQTIRMAKTALKNWQN